INGSFADTFVVGLHTYGTTTVTATGLATNAVEKTTFDVVSAITQVAPTQGTVGTIVTVQGNGFGASEQVAIGFGNMASIALCSTDDYGSFTTSWTVDTQSYGTKSVFATGTVSGEVAISTFKIIGRFYGVSPNRGSVGTIVTIRGDGYKYEGLGERLYVDFGQTPNIIPTTVWNFAAENGSWTLTFTVNTQPQGTTTIAVQGNGSGQNITNVFNIEPHILQVNPTSGFVGSTVTITGDGFGVSETISIKFGTTANIALVSTSDKGTWTAAWTVDTQSYGTTSIVAVGDMSGVSEWDEFVIKARITSVSPSQGTVGTVITVEGNGYKASECVAIGFGNHSTITTAVVDGSGVWTASFTVDTQCYDTTNITAIGTNSGASSTGNFKILAEVPCISPTIGTVGTVVTVLGTGYAASEWISIGFGTINQLILQAGTTSLNGSFSVTFEVNTQPYGTTTVKAYSKGFSSTRFFERGFIITSKIISITPGEGTVGTTVSVYGDGFGANEGINIKFGNATTIAMTTSLNTGYFSCAFTVNAQGFGTTTILANGLQDIGSHTGQAEFKIRGRMTEVTPLSGTVGSRVTVKGDGYKGNEVIAINFGDTMSITTANAAGTGVFAIGWTVDTQSLGTKTITIFGLGSGETNTAASFTIKPEIWSVSPTRGSIGTTIVLKMTGYGQGEWVSIDFGDMQNIGYSSEVTSGSGTALATITIQAQPYGTTTIMAVGTNTLASAVNKFVIIPNITLVTPKLGSVGTMVSVTGDGYGKSETVTVQFGTGAVSLTKTTIANQLGTFSLTWTVNTQAYGTKTITASGTATDTHKAENYEFKIMPSIIEVTLGQGTVGQMITVKGNGYASNEQVKIGFGTNDTILSYNYADPNGSFSCSFTVDTQAYGTASVIATGITSEVATATFFIKTSIYSISPSEGTVGSLLIINGNGFEAGGALSIRFGVTQLIDPGTTTIAGSFERVWTLDEQPGGTITARASTSEQAWAERAFYIKANIHTVNPLDGSIGTSVTIVGNGYQASDTVLVSFGTTPTIGTTSASGVANPSDGLGGTFTLIFTINSQPCGSTTITAKGQILNSAFNIFYIKAAIYSLTPTAGTVGTLVSIFGNGYKVGETINIKLGTNDMTTTIGVADGRFTASFNIDTQPFGTTTISAIDADEPFIAGYERFIIRPVIYAITPTIGTVGSLVTINGNGFGAIEGIRVALGTTPTIIEVATDGSGVFEAIFTIDNQSIGTNTITAYGTTTGTSAVTYFTVKPRLTSIVPDTGSVGTVVSLSGDGYQAWELVRVKFGNNNTITTTAALTDGCISTNFTIDTQVYGTTAVTAIGAASGGMANIDFVIIPNVHTVTPRNGTVGMTVTVAGDGFNFIGGKKVVVDFGSTTGRVDVAASDNGSFSTTFTVDTQFYGTKTVHAYIAGTPEINADNSFKIIPAIHTVTP
ncbi:hypothetical protein COZ71_08470, partial [Candidatus Desantisbacteria bacterium CG_4_8_14_3_um_filter_40_12]